MPILTGILNPAGALVDVRLGWSDADAQKQRRALRPVPPSGDFRAVLDTGAEITCLDTTVVQQLGLPVEGMTITNVPVTGGLTYGMQHRAKLVVVHNAGNPHDDLVVDSLGPVDDQSRFRRMNPRARWIIPRNVCFSFS